VIAINITNRYLDLAPVVAEAAAANGFTGIVVDDDGNDENYYSPSSWILLSRAPAIFNHANFQDRWSVSDLKRKPGFRVWTDDYSNIVQILQ
jgi:hypothetical protein